MPSENKDNSTTHYIYWICILGTIIVLGSTYIFFKGKLLISGSDFVGYISFAATIASLILSLVAIFYAIQSTNSFAGTISELNKSSSNIASGSSDIARGAIEIKEALRDGIEKLNEKFEHHRIKTESTLERTEHKLESLSSSGLNSLHQETDNIDMENQDSMLLNFLNRSSILGLIAIYISYKSFKEGKAVNLEMISELTKAPVDYVYAYCVAANCLRLTNSEILQNENEATMLNCSSINESLLIDIRERIIFSINNTFKGESQIDFVERVRKLDLYFKEI